MLLRVACTAPTAWAPTRCSTCWCSAARPATTSSSSTDKQKEHKPLPADAADRTLARLSRLETSTGGEYAQDVANDIRAAMQQHAGVFRTAGLDGRRRRPRSPQLRERVKAASRLKDKSKVFNTARIEALEVDNLIEVAQATMISAAARKECRGAHTVDDYERPRTTIRPLGRDDNELDEAHAVVQRRQPPRLQAGEAEAADRRHRFRRRSVRSKRPSSSDRALTRSPR